MIFRLVKFDYFIQTNKYVSLWDNGNRENVTVDVYMKGVNAMKPTAFVALNDGETSKNCLGKGSN
jgi:hypothetical protein